MRTFTTDIDELGRVCTKCLVYKTWDRYYKHKKSSTGYSQSCIDCHNEKYPPEYYRQRQLAEKYGITLSEYEGMFEDQEGVCAICQKPSDRPLVVDHCHATGRVRGLLCFNCNVGLGYYADRPECLRRAADYLENL